MITLLSDHNIEGQTDLLFRSLASEGWVSLLPMQLKTFNGFGLPDDIDDRSLWFFIQEKSLLLLTANRNMLGPDSLEYVIREQCRPDSLPVLTIGDPDRIAQREYRNRCEESLLDICLYLDRYLGIGRVYL